MGDPKPDYLSMPLAFGFGGAVKNEGKSCGVQNSFMRGTTRSTLMAGVYAPSKTRHCKDMVAQDDRIILVRVSEASLHTLCCMQLAVGLRSRAFAQKSRK